MSVFIAFNEQESQTYSGWVSWQRLKSSIEKEVGLKKDEEIVSLDVSEDGIRVNIAIKNKD